MEISSDTSVNADEGGAKEGEVTHLNEMSIATSPGGGHGEAGEVQQAPRVALADNIDELDQRLAVLSGDMSPSRSSNASFQIAPEQISPIRPSEKALGKRKEQDPPEQPDPASVPLPCIQHQSLPTTQTSSRPTTSHRVSTRPSTRRHSTAPTSQIPSSSSSKREARVAPQIQPSASSSRHGAAGPNGQSASASSSRRSSFNVNPPAAAPTSRPTHLRHRRHNSTWPTATVIPNGKQAVKSVQAFSSLRADILSSIRAEERLKSTSLPALPRPATSVSPTANDSPQQDPSNPPEFSNHVPASNIDWMSPSTRRREYEKIDKARKGIRGLLRRVTPRILLREGRRGFHGEHGDGEGSDAGTVRRFRMDVGDGVEEGSGGGGADEGGKKKSWWKLMGKKIGKKIGNGMGRGEACASAEGGLESSL